MITVAGMSPSLDLTYVVADLRLGTIHRPTAVVRSAGGKSLNLARAAAVLGADVHLVGVFAGTTGHWLAGALRELGIGVDEIEAPGETRTCVSIGSTRTGELTELYPYAGAVPDAAWRDLADQLSTRCAQRPGWLAISGLAPAGTPDDAVAGLIRAAHAAGVRVAVDTHGAALGPAVAARPALTKVNRTEAAELLGLTADADLHEMATAIAERTGGAVVLTDGAAGALGVDPTGSWRIAPAAHRGGYPVGSGDSFLGGLVAELDAGADLPTALRWAAACGTANALVPGTAEFSREQATAEHALVEITALG